MNATALGILSALAVLLALAFKGLDGLLFLIALCAGWWIVWWIQVGAAAYRSAREERRRADAATAKPDQAQQMLEVRSEHARQQELDRIALLTGLLILAFCILAYLQDGSDGLFIAVLISIGTVCGFLFYGITAARRRR